MRLRPVPFLSAVAVVAASLPVFAQGPVGNAEAAKTKVSMCIGCHGIPGYKAAYPEVYHVPKISGQTPAYIVNALKAYKAGERSHGSMRGVASSLTEQDMADLAAYYGARK